MIQQAVALALLLHLPFVIAQKRQNRQTMPPAATTKAHESRVTGIWMVTFSPGHVPKAVDKKVLVITKKGGVLQIEDPQTRKKSIGLKSSNEVFLPIPMKRGEGDNSINLNGEFQSDGNLAGSAQIDGVTQKWKMTRLSSVWVCGNHDPKHAATSTEEIAELTQTNGCAAWHRVLFE